MQGRDLIWRSLTYHWRTNLAVMLGVASATAVLTGALLVGDSVRGSLRDVSARRLGNADYVIGSASFFRERLADELQQRIRQTRRRLLPTDEAPADMRAVPVILLDGTVIHQPSSRRGSARIYGIDERFWDFHGHSDIARLLGDRDVLVSADLARELHAAPGDALLVTLERPSAIPSGSLYGRKEDNLRTLRLALRDVLSPARLGEFSLRADQGPVRAVFVPLARLQREVNRDAHVNTILIAVGTSSGAGEVEIGNRLWEFLKQTATLEDVGIRVRDLKSRDALSLESERSILNEAVLKAGEEAAAKLGLRSSPVLTYLANSLRIGDRSIPYSLVTALDLTKLKYEVRSTKYERPNTDHQEVSTNDQGPSTKHQGPSTKDQGLRTKDQGLTTKDQGPVTGGARQGTRDLPPIVLNEWAARELAARVGQELTLEYFLWHDNGTLATRTAQFRVTGIVTIEGATADPDLTPHYEGITDSDDLGDWDPPFPIDLSRIRPRDEQYWDRYRTTPKAYVPLEVGQRLWATRYGPATSLRMTGIDQAISSPSLYSEQLTAILDPINMGFFVQAVRKKGFDASQGSTDFGEYFLYFSFFLLVSALLLAVLFFRLEIEQRQNEIGLLRAIGYSIARIRGLLLAEGMVLSAVGSLMGVVGAIAYGRLLMHGLQTWWVGAVGTTALTLYVTPRSLVIGATGSMLAALACITWTMRSVARVSPRRLLTRAWDPTRQQTSLSRSPRAWPAAMVFGAVGALLLSGGWMQWLAPAAAYFGAGISLLVALCWSELGWLRRRDVQPVHGQGWWAVSRLGLRFASARPGRSIFCIVLIASATFLIVSLDGFRRDEAISTLDHHSGTGGFPLLAESIIPVFHDPMSVAGREVLNVASDALPWLETTLARFRLRPGDDASCLNLYRPQDPRILGVTAEFIEEGRFSFESSIAATPSERANPWVLLHTPQNDGAVPIVADANSLKYVMHLNLGDQLVLPLTGRNDRPIRLRVVGALADSVFQSELLMSEEHFVKLFPELGGYRFFLIDVPAHRANEVSQHLEERLSDLGFDVMSTTERLASFHRVENTYLSTFQALGSLGLALGTLGLATVLLRNVLERRRELALLRAIGYSSTDFYLMHVAENTLLLLTGMLTGTICALLAIIPTVATRGGRLPGMSVSLLLLIVVITGLAASLLATRVALGAPLLAALRSE